MQAQWVPILLFCSTFFVMLPRENDFLSRTCIKQKIFTESIMKSNRRAVVLVGFTIHSVNKDINSKLGKRTIQVRQKST